MEKKNLKVTETLNQNNEPVPHIDLEGEWLSKMGFEAFTDITVFCEKNKLILKNSKTVSNPPTKETIKAIYDSRINPWSYYEEHYKEYWDWMGMFLEKSDKFPSQLPEELKSSFTELIDMLCTASEIAADGNYVEGFEMGLRTAVEALYGTQQ